VLLPSLVIFDTLSSIPLHVTVTTLKLRPVWYTLSGVLYWSVNAAIWAAGCVRDEAGLLNIHHMVAASDVECWRRVRLTFSSHPVMLGRAVISTSRDPRPYKDYGSWYGCGALGLLRSSWFNSHCGAHILKYFFITEISTESPTSVTQILEHIKIPTTETMAVPDVNTKKKTSQLESKSSKKLSVPYECVRKDEVFVYTGPNGEIIRSPHSVRKCQIALRHINLPVLRLSNSNRSWLGRTILLVLMEPLPLGINM